MKRWNRFPETFSTNLFDEWHTHSQTLFKKLVNLVANILQHIMVGKINKAPHVRHHFSSNRQALLFSIFLLLFCWPFLPHLHFSFRFSVSRARLLSLRLSLFIRFSIDVPSFSPSFLIFISPLPLPRDIALPYSLLFFSSLSSPSLLACPFFLSFPPSLSIFPASA